MNIAIIPARGGSKRIPRKNIRPFHGKPMIGYAIEAAFASGVFGQIVVSTDDEEIAGVAKEFGAGVPFLRPAALADDHAGTLPVIAHAIEACRELGWCAGLVCCIYPAVPLLTAEELRAGLALMESGGAEYVFPVIAFPSAVQRALRRLPDGSMQSMYPEYVHARTQDLEPAYYDAGQFYWGTSGAWLSGHSPHMYGKGLVVPEWRAVDMDTPEDWNRAERLFSVLASQRISS